MTNKTTRPSTEQQDFEVTGFEYTPDTTTVGSPLRRKITVRNVTDREIWPVRQIEFFYADNTGKVLQKAIHTIFNGVEMEFTAGQERTLIVFGAADFPEGTAEVILTRYSSGNNLMR
jgi:hypothetical protein